MFQLKKQLQGLGESVHFMTGLRIDDKIRSTSGQTVKKSKRIAIKKKEIRKRKQNSRVG